MDLELEDEILNRSVEPVKWKVLGKLSVWEQVERSKDFAKISRTRL